MQKGIQKAKLEDARRMLEREYDVNDIACITGLTIKEIKALKKEIE
jgi:predicted transposase/invertase (TIGR01784 family)